MIETEETSFTRTLWPVHLKPQEDELLSSWLARLALAHGQTVATFTSQVWPRTHPGSSRCRPLERSRDV